LKEKENKMYPKKLTFLQHAKYYLISIAVIGLALAISIVTNQSGAKPATSLNKFIPVTSGQPAGPRNNMANPAAVYCTDLGYELQTITDEAGGQRGNCIMPDQTKCDEWDFLAGKCGQEFSYCAKHGYQTRVAKDSNNGYSLEYAVCVDHSGKDVGSVTQLDELFKKSSSWCPESGSRRTRYLLCGNW
jgi:putative hemolysin